MAANDKTKTEKKRNRLVWDAQHAKGSAMSTGITMLAATGGAFIGSQLGKWSLAAGGLTALAGAYLEKPWVTTLGASVFAGGVISVMHEPPTDPDAKKEPFSLKAQIEQTKASADGFGKALMRTTFLDKVIKPKEAAPTKTLQGVDYSHFAVLDQMEQNLLASAVAFNAANPRPAATPNAVGNIPDMDRY
jgi:hypothetical protein